MIRLYRPVFLHLGGGYPKTLGIVLYFHQYTINLLMVLIQHDPGYFHVS